MAVEVRLPPCCAPTPTARASVTADGATVGEVFGDLTTGVPGPRGPARRRLGRAAQVRQRVRERRRHPLPRPARHQGRPTATSSRSCPRSPAADLPPPREARESILDLIGNTPLVGVHALSPNPDVRIYAKLEGQNPGGSLEGPHRAEDGRPRRGRRRAHSRARRSSSRRRATPASGSRWSPSSAATGSGS